MKSVDEIMPNDEPPMYSEIDYNNMYPDIDYDDQPNAPPAQHQPMGPPQAQPYYSQPPVAVHPQSIVYFGHQPMNVTCSNCGFQGNTRVQHEPNMYTWFSCLGCSLFGCILGCCLVPFCIDSLQRATHSCSRCERVLGVRDAP